jgi:hypothetical protein
MLQAAHLCPTYQLRKHLLQLVQVHNGHILCLGLSDSTDSSFWHNTRKGSGRSWRACPDPSLAHSTAALRRARWWLQINSLSGTELRC